MENRKLQYELAGLCCGKCAAKIEREVGGLAGVTSAVVDFTSKRLTLELTGDTAPESICGQIQSIATQHDPDIEVKACR